MEDYTELTRQEIINLHVTTEKELNDLQKAVAETRDYLMGVNPSELKIEKIFVLLGYTENGF